MDMHQVALLGKKIQQRGPYRGDTGQWVAAEAYQDPTPVGMRQRRRGHRRLTVSEKVDIAHKVICQLRG